MDAALIYSGEEKAERKSNPCLIQYDFIYFVPNYSNSYLEELYIVSERPPIWAVGSDEKNEIMDSNGTNELPLKGGPPLAIGWGV